MDAMCYIISYNLSYRFVNRDLKINLKYDKIQRIITQNQYLFLIIRNN